MVLCGSPADWKWNVSLKSTALAAVTPVGTPCNDLLSSRSYVSLEQQSMGREFVWSPNLYTWQSKGQRPIFYILVEQGDRPDSLHLLEQGVRGYPLTTLLSRNLVER